MKTSARSLAVFLLTAGPFATSAFSPASSGKWEELTAGDFQQAIRKAQNTCVLPFGIIEKHGPHLPLGTDLINVRYAALHGAEREYAVVFPEYYFGQIFEAKHEPGTMAYSAKLQLELLQETTDEMARNGCEKILIVNGHGGNNHLLPFFAQAQMAAPHDYVVYVYMRPPYPPGRVRRAHVNVHDIVMGRGHLRLGEEGKQVIIPAMSVDDQDLLASVARHFVRSLLEEFQLQLRAVSHGAGLMLRFENLAEVILGKNDRIFTLGSV